MRPHQPSGRAAARISELLGFAFFSALSLARLARHPMWRDELQAWLIATASAHPLDLLRHLRFEGHPPLWHLLLWPLTRLTSDPVAMQALQGAVGIAILWLIWRASPFTAVERALLSASYFLAFEYGILARSYGVLALLLFAFAELRRRAPERTLAAWLLLGLLANTHFFGCVAAIVLGAHTLWHDRLRLARHRAGLALFAPLLTLAGALMVRADLSRPYPWYLRLDPERLLFALSALQKAFAPIGDPGSWDFWLAGPDRGAALALAALAMALVTIQLRNHPAALMGLLAAIAATLLLFWLRYGGLSFHAGTLFVLFVGLVWICGDRGATRAPRWALLALLALNAFGGVKAMVASQMTPFSRARETAGWIRARGLGDELWIGSIDWAAAAVAGYLGRPIWYLECGCPGTYVEWSAARREVSPAELAPAVVEALRRNRRESGYVLLNYAWPRPADAATRGLSVTALADFGPAHVRDEEFFVYAVRLTD